MLQRSIQKHWKARQIADREKVRASILSKHLMVQGSSTRQNQVVEESRDRLRPSLNLYLDSESNTSVTSFGSPTPRPLSPTPLSPPRRQAKARSANSRVSKEDASGRQSPNLQAWSKMPSHLLPTIKLNEYATSNGGSPRSQQEQGIGEDTPVNHVHDFVAEGKRPSWAVESEKSQEEEAKHKSMRISIDDDIRHEDSASKQIIEEQEELTEEVNLLYLSSSNIDGEGLTKTSFGPRDISNNPRLAQGSPFYSGSASKSMYSESGGNEGEESNTSNIGIGEWGGGDRLFSIQQTYSGK